MSFQSLQRREPRVLPLRRAVARPGIQVRAALHTEPPALVPAKGLHRERQIELLPQQFVQIDLIVAVVAVIFSVLFVIYSRDTAASGFAVYLPFIYLLGVLLIAIPVYVANRSRMTPAGGAPPAQPIAR